MDYNELSAQITSKRNEWQQAKAELYDGIYVGDPVERSEYINALGDEITELSNILETLPQPEVILPDPMAE